MHTNKDKKRPDMLGNKFGFKKGAKPWNKGLKGLKIGFAVIPQPEKHWAKGKTKHTHSSLKKISEHHRGSGNPVWKGGNSQGYIHKMIRQLGIKRNKCSWCKSKIKICIHHKDEDRTNNKKSNLVAICSSCHVKHHNPRYGTGKQKK